jgi:hypothetical protein
VQKRNHNFNAANENNRYQRAGRKDAEPITCEEITVVGSVHF